MMHTPAHHSTTAAQVEISADRTTQGPDFIFVSHGSLILLTPMSEAGKGWVAEHLPEDRQRWGRGIAIEPRYWEPIYLGIQEDGLTVL
jgi:hypothetical protein